MRRKEETKKDEKKGSRNISDGEDAMLSKKVEVSAHDNPRDHLEC